MSAPVSAALPLRAFAMAPLARLSGASDAPHAAWLERARQALGDHTAWAAGFAEALRQARLRGDPLARAHERWSLSLVEVAAVSLSAAVEEDLMAGRAVAALQHPIGGSRPCLSLIESAYAEYSRGRSAADDLLDGAALQTGLLQLQGDALPLAERALAVPFPILRALAGRDAAPAGARFPRAAATAIVLPESVRARVTEEARLLTAGRSLAIRAASPAERTAAAHLVAQALGLRLVLLSPDPAPGLGLWLTLRGLLPAWDCALGPGEKFTLAAVRGYDGPTLVLCGQEGMVLDEHGAVPSWSLSVPAADERETLWRHSLANSELAEELARDRRFSAGYIAHLGDLCQREAAREGGGPVRRYHVRRVLRSPHAYGLDHLAEHVAGEISDDAFVLPPSIQPEMDVLVERCRHRDQLAAGLGISVAARYRPGVRVLFSGASGTGKTLAAGWLATRLGAPLYRVDLAAVTSKYIGETEKNLAQILALAEHANVILLFDEADAMFGRRTEVKDANDRFANGQTNYLLQRIESYEGIVVLTSNNPARLDNAFLRRLDFVVEIPLPGVDERRRLWLSHLGDGHSLSERDLNILAAALDFAGGQVRTAVLTAAVLARRDAKAVGMDHLVHAIAMECRKSGRGVPRDLAEGH